LISKVEQVETDPISGEPDCKLTDPVRVYFLLEEIPHGKHTKDHTHGDEKEKHSKDHTHGDEKGKYSQGHRSEFVLERWPEFDVTDQKVVMLHSDAILTIVEPSKRLLKVYEDFIKE